MTYRRFIAAASYTEAMGLINVELSPTHSLASQGRLKDDKIFEVEIKIKEVKE